MNRNLLSAAIAATFAAPARASSIARDFGHRHLARHALFEQINLRELNRTDAGDPWKPGTVDIGNVAYASVGTSAVHVAGTIYLSEINLTRSKPLVTGIGVLNGATVGTDNLIVALYGPTGQLLANSALAGVLSAGANAFQEIPFVTPIPLKNDGLYWIGVQCNGTTATTRRIAASTFLRRTKSSTGVFGTLPPQTVPSTFTADVGPVAYLY